MAIYKHVMPDHNVGKEEVKQVTDNHETSATVHAGSSNEMFEYFSDKEEAEKHKKTEKQNPHVL